MSKRSGPRLVILLMAGILFITSCSINQVTVLVSSTPTDVSLPTNTIVIVKQTATDLPQPTSTSMPTQPIPSETPAPTLTPTWIYHEPGKINAPILLYHHVEGETSTSRYQVSVTDFRAQMNALHDLGYTTIPISLFLDALIQGSDLPEKPIVITFDDGHLSVYENAYPIMAELGFSGVFYIVANRINDVPDFVNVIQLQEMIDSGWEIGSHGYSHTDVTQNHDLVNQEIAQSKTDLASALSTKIQTFAYPFGAIDPFVGGKVYDYGYRAGMGLGTSRTHTLGTLFYLDRIEIYGNTTPEDFIRLLQQE